MAQAAASCFCRQEQEEDEEDVFQPQLGNVVFASAHDGWAFRPAQFAALYAAKLGANPAALGKACPAVVQAEGVIVCAMTCLASRHRVECWKLGAPSATCQQDLELRC